MSLQSPTWPHPEIERQRAVNTVDPFMAPMKAFQVTQILLCRLEPALDDRTLRHGFESAIKRPPIVGGLF